MKIQKVRLWNSIIFRFGIFIMGIVLFAILITGFLVHRESSRNIKEFSKIRLDHNLNLAKNSFYSLLNEVAGDIAILSENPELVNYLENGNTISKDNAKELISSNLRNKQEYFQFSAYNLASLEGRKIEIAKVNDNITERSIQQFKHIDSIQFLKNLLMLGDGQYYFSEMYLEEQTDQPNAPLIPTFKAGGPIFNKAGIMIGVISINVSLSNFFNQLISYSQSGFEFFLIDNDDQYLFSKEKSKCFAYQFGAYDSFINDYSLSIQNISAVGIKNGNIKDNDGRIYQFSLDQLSYPNINKKIYLMSYADQLLLNKSLAEIRSKGLKWTLLISGLCLLLGIVLTYFYSKNILQISSGLANYENLTDENPLFNLSKRKDELGQLIRTFRVMRAKIKKQMEALQKALNNEQEAIRQRDIFLQNMSHELRTPLNAIIGLSQLLKKNTLLPNQEGIIKSLTISSEHLSGLMHDILDYQKLVERKLNLILLPENIAKIFQDIHSSYRYEAIKKNLIFNIVLDQKLYENYYLTDRLRLSQIVLNLIMNAIKYTDEGSVTLEGRINQIEEQEFFEVTIRDTGIGISEENLTKINERFFQIHDIADRKGFGLGLSIVIQLTQLFNGNLKVSSKLGFGSLFSVTIPLQKASSTSTIAQIGSKIKFPTLNKTFHILHLEDDGSTSHLFAHLLEEHPFILHQVENLRDAKVISENTIPDLIISDLYLHGLNTSAFIIHQKEKGVPIIIVSGNSEISYFDISNYLFLKPFNIDLLLDAIYSILGQKKYHIPDLDNIKKLYDNNPHKFLRYLELLQKELSEYFERFFSFQQNGLSKKDWEDVTHKLVNHIKSLSLEDLGSLIEISYEEVDKNIIDKILNILLFNLTFIRSEKYRLSQKLNFFH